MKSNFGAASRRHLDVKFCYIERKPTPTKISSWPSFCGRLKLLICWCHSTFRRLPKPSIYLLEFRIEMKFVFAKLEVWSDTLVNENWMCVCVPVSWMIARPDVPRKTLCKHFNKLSPIHMKILSSNERINLETTIPWQRFWRVSLGISTVLIIANET